MMRRFHRHFAVMLAAGVVLPALIGGCNGSTSSGVLFLDFVQTILLGVTAAGAVFLIREVN